MKKILFIVQHRKERSPGQRFRFEQYLDFLEANGYEYVFSNYIDEKDDRYFYSKGLYFRKFIIFLKAVRQRFKDLRTAKNCDIIFIYREAIMVGSTYFEKQFRKKGKKIVMDFDDSIFLLDTSKGNQWLQFLKKPGKTAEILSLADLAIVGNHYLAGYAKQYCKNVAVIPTTIDTALYYPVPAGKTGEQICIGWIGSRTTIKHLEWAIPIMKALYQKFGNRIYFKVIADVPLRVENLPVQNIKWKKDSEIEELRKIDIGIMPLPDNEWTRGKCGFKGLQYMSLGIPTVMSPVGMNREIIHDGKNGFLANDIDEWIDKISRLIEDDDLRAGLGAEGAKTIEEKYSFNSQKNLYLSLLNGLLQDHKV